MSAASDPTERFGDRAGAYARGRPDYPAAALAFVLDGLPVSPLVADLGAGTGIAARLLADRGARVVAVEPNAGMRAHAAAHPGVRWLAATAQATTLDDAGVDAVTAFQAFHWFADDAALREIRRVVRPGGRAVMVQNERDERDAFTAAYGAIVCRYATDDTETRRRHALEVFGHIGALVERREFPHAQPVDLTTLLARAASTSYLPHAGDAAAALDAELRALYARFDRGPVSFAMRTSVLRATLGSPAA